MSQKIAIQGSDGSFHSLAAMQYFGPDITLIPCDTFSEVFRALKHHQCDQAIVAIENSLYGSINNVYDLLLDKKSWISGEIYLHITQCLIGLPGATLADITEVHSQGPALGQCDVYLDTYLPKARRVEEHDTAGSVALIKKLANPHKAAIASPQAAELYGLSILASEIETHTDNFTRFVIIQNESVEVPKADKTSLILTTNHQPGALYDALKCFKDQNINLTKLQSRPVIGKKWHYMFYIDLTAGLTSTALQKALSDLKTQKCEVTILGSYRAGST